ncbi:CotH kinase family protein [Salinivirga cyanobacteriivorans]
MQYIFKAFWFRVIIIGFAFAVSISDSSGQSLVINEVMFANHSTIEDEDGDTPDWVELFNSGNETLNLRGYQLTDDTTEISHWSFPDYNMMPGEFLVVFLSGKNRISGNEFHCDFKLSLMEEQLFLLTPNNEIIDYTDITCVPEDKSLGCQPDGQKVGRQVLMPTPGASNNDAQYFTINYLPDSLMCNLTGGFYDQPIAIEFSNLYNQNEIHYTLDGDEPDMNESIYSDSIILHDRTPENLRFADQVEDEYNVGDAISKAQVVRAQVFSEGCPASEVFSQTYFIGPHFQDAYDVPVVALITDEDNLFDPEEGIYVEGLHQNFNRRGKAWERAAYVEIYDSAGIKVIDQATGARIHGNGSRSRPQKSFRLYARNEYGQPWFNYPLFSQKPEIERYKRLLLRSTKDWGSTLVKDELTQSLIKSMNTDYTATETCVVFLNGEYWGVYGLKERQDEYYTASNYNVDIQPINIIAYTGSGAISDEGEIASYQQLVSWLDTVDPQSSGFFAEASKRIDLEALIDYYVAELYFANTDFPENNLRLWRWESDSARWRYFFYDCDACMLRPNYDHLGEYSHNNESFNNYKPFASHILRRLLQNDTFAAKFKTELIRHLNSTFAPDRVLKKIEKYEEKYAPLVPEHCYRWGTPTDYGKWQKNLVDLKTFALQRPVALKSQINKYLGNPLEIFPNPSTGLFSLKAEWAQGALKVTIRDLYGRLIYQSGFPSAEFGIELSPGLNPGFYIVSIHADGMTFSQKLIIAKP